MNKNNEPLYTYEVYYGENLLNFSKWRCEARNKGDAMGKFRRVFGYNYLRILSVKEVSV